MSAVIFKDKPGEGAKLLIETLAKHFSNQATLKILTGAEALEAKSKIDDKVKVILAEDGKSQKNLKAFINSPEGQKRFNRPLF